MSTGDEEGRDPTHHDRPLGTRDRDAAAGGTARAARLRARLAQGLAAEHVELVDESDRHVGHAGAAGGAGHYRVVVVSDRFRDRDAVARHRLVYDAVGDLIPAEVHALAIAAYTPEEWRARASDAR